MKKTLFLIITICLFPVMVSAAESSNIHFDCDSKAVSVGSSVKCYLFVNSQVATGGLSGKLKLPSSLELDGDIENIISETWPGIPAKGSLSFVIGGDDLPASDTKVLTFNLKGVNTSSDAEISLEDDFSLYDSGALEAINTTTVTPYSLTVVEKVVDDPVENNTIVSNNNTVAPQINVTSNTNTVIKNNPETGSNGLYLAVSAVVLTSASLIILLKTKKHVI